MLFSALDHSSPPPLVQVEHLSRAIGSRTRKTVILDDVTFSVPSGSLFAINGPSGSGKSTLLNMLTGIDRPTSGRVIFADQELRVMGEDSLALTLATSVLEHRLEMGVLRGGGNRLACRRGLLCRGIGPGRACLCFQYCVRPAGRRDPDPGACHIPGATRHCCLSLAHSEYHSLHHHGGNRCQRWPRFRRLTYEHPQNPAL